LLTYLLIYLFAYFLTLMTTAVRRRLLLPMLLSVCLSRGFTQLRFAKTAERIEILFGVKTFGGSRNIVLDGGLDPSQLGEEKRIPGSLCQITLASCLCRRGDRFGDAVYRS